jgi:polysaccharide deacetylase 2 family uncharacterized protein YibQ
MARRGRTTGVFVGLALAAVLAARLLRHSAPERPAQAPGTELTPVPLATPEPLPSPTALPAGPLLAVVIDDWGYQARPIAALGELGFTVTTAILPNLPYSRRAAEAAEAAGDELILHCPMQAKGPIKAEQGTLKAGMNPAQAQAQLAKHWASVPRLKGLNNHEGSRATEDPALMAVVARFLHDQGGYFLDSVTTPHSAIPAAARAAGVPWARRRVFLDNENNAAAIEKQLRQAAALAAKTGSCIAIGHPYPHTLEVLKRLGPQLQAQGIHFVPVSALVKP